MKKLIIAALSAIMLVSCAQNHPVDFKRNRNGFTISNKDIRLQFQLDSIPGAVTVNDIPVCGSIGLGGSAPFGNSGFYLPENKGSVEIVDWNDERIIVHENFPSWRIFDNKVNINRQLTMYADSCFLEVYDYYYGEFDKLHIATAIPDGRISGDTAITELGGLTVNVHMEDCASVRSFENQIIIDKEIFRNEPVHYKVYFKNFE